MLTDSERLDVTVRKALLEARQEAERCLESRVEGGPREGGE